VGGDSSAEAIKGDASEDDKDHEIANLRYQLRQSVQQQQVCAGFCMCHNSRVLHVPQRASTEP